LLCAIENYNFCSLPLAYNFCSLAMCNCHYLYTDAVKIGHLFSLALGARSCRAAGPGSGCAPSLLGSGPVRGLRLRQRPCSARHVSACFSLFQLILSHIILLNQSKSAGFSTGRTSPAARRGSRDTVAVLLLINVK
jgi:hypothetical protein